MNCKITLLSAIMVVASASANAQTFFPKAGLSMATLSSRDVQPANVFHNGGRDIKLRAGFLIGCGLSIPLGKSISLQPEWQYIQKGTRTHNEFDISQPDDTGIKTVKITNNFRTNYLEQVLAARFDITRTQSSLTGYFIAGTTLSVGVGGRGRHYSRDEYFDNHVEEVKRKFDLKFSGASWTLGPYDHKIERRADVGLCLGAGVILAKKLMVDLRYSHGLRSMYKPASYDIDGTHYSYQNKIHHRGIQLAVALPFSPN